MLISKKKMIYIYHSRKSGVSKNPYLMNLIQSFSGNKNYTVVNKNDSSSIGIINIFKYIFKAQYFYFNWVENTPDKKYGIIQSKILLYAIIPLLVFLNKKMIWTCHNKLSHSNNNLKLKKKLFDRMALKSDYIITHSSEGVSYISKKYNRIQDVYFLHHPASLNKSAIGRVTKKDFDILIWGTIQSYKGIYEFLDYLNKSGLDEKYKIRIVGSCLNKYYLEKIKSFENSYIEIQDRYIDIEDLINFLNRAKIILFTYKPDSVLSSGTLIDSILYHNRVVGPNFSCFEDLSKLGLVHVYDNFDTLTVLIEKLIRNRIDIHYRKSIDRYVSQNDWTDFSNKLSILLK